jgi:hypothetical protein
MEKVKNESLNPYGGQFNTNAAQFIKQMNELSESGIQTEEQLNLLRLSNVKRLGTLRKQQEQEILEAALKANKRLIDDRLVKQKKALDEEEKATIAKRVREEKAKAKKNGNKLSKEEIEKIKEEESKRFEERRKHLKEQAE